MGKPTWKSTDRVDNLDLAAMPEEDLEAIAFHVVPVATLVELCNPLACWMEQSSPITAKAVRECIKAGQADLCDTPTWSQIAFGQAKITPQENRARHIRKIAYFVLNPINDPIDIDVGFQAMGCLPPSHMVQDGNHRLAAAIIKGETTVCARVNGGVEDARQMGLWHPNPAFEELEKRWEKKYAKPRGPKA